ncbi:prostatic acid phosphatase-like [Paramacrobiotus metropolitanus]|uniref:prostatic acid phosphatase-like n=1 Tax=Paramacrobiotus metropolitanus TaxID=2943436 RepID=UPI0024458223|nr:prostatic acid phosphatase-like [Paramacrobiotus metropolitanus]
MARLAAGLLVAAIAVLLVGETAGLEKVGKNLKFLIAIFRHGYRATAYTYKNDPHGESVWPSGFSSLTPRGVQQHYKLGSYLRQRYDGYINPKRAVKEIYVRATNYDRTIQSAMANMAGWFPPAATDVWANTALGKLWRPFPVRLADDPTLLGETDCERIDDKAYRGRPDLQKIFDTIEFEHKEFLDHVRRQSGEPNMRVQKGLEEVSDVLRCQKYNGVKLPEWVTDEVYDKIQYLDNLRFHVWVGGNGDVQRARVNAGKLLRHFITSFRNKINNVTKVMKEYKAYAYASHDNSIGGLLSCLDLYDYDLRNPVAHIPLYANMLLFELYNDNTVRILHKNDTTEDDFTSKDPIVLKHPECDVYCPLDKLDQLTREYQPDSDDVWKGECENHSRQRFRVKRPIHFPPPPLKTKPFETPKGPYQQG